VGIIKVKGNIGTATGKHFFLPGLFFVSRAKHPFVVQDKRVTPVDVRYAKLEQDDVTYHLPPGFNVESAPHTGNHVVFIVAKCADSTFRIVLPNPDCVSLWGATTIT
jgi:hypothetical protein